MNTSKPKLIRGNRFASAILVAFACALLSLMSVDQAWAQGEVTSATLAGDVIDKTGAVLPGAKVTVRNQQTGLTREAVSDQSGHFVVAQLPAGTYEVSVEAAGFKKALIRDLQLNVGATETLKIPLEVGEVIESIDVSADAVPVVETTKTEVSEVIQAVQVRELPLNQRSFTALVTQQPNLVVMTNASGNTTQTPTTVAFAQGSMISANGQVSQSMAYLIDGVVINNSGFGAPGTAAGGDIPGVEAIQEFKVLTQNYSAAYGGSAGAVVSFATRSGTNEFHGSVYEFLRNNIFDARGPFDTLDLDGDGLADLPPFRRNQFGATFGGPIKRDKVFFFTNYEGLRRRLTTTEIGFVPSVEARNGGVGGTSGFPVIGPIRQPDGTYKRGPVAISPGVKAILDLFPLPNGRELGGGTAEYIFQNPQPVRQDFSVFKIDYSATAKDIITGRYWFTDAEGTNAYFLPTYEFIKDTRFQHVLLKWTRTFSSNLVGTASLGFVRSNTFAATGPTVPLRPEQYTGNPARKIVGTISVGSTTSGNTSGTLSTIGSDNWGPYRGVTNSFPFNYDMIYTRHAHTIKIGGMVNRRQWNLEKGNLIGGGYTFRSVNDFLAANPATVIILVDGASPQFGYRTTQLAWYVEDAWRVRPNLTITMGLRHEFQVPVLSEVNGKLGNVTSQQATGVTVGQPWDNYSLTQFQPRLGIAYDPFNDAKTIIRTGIGLFNDFIPLEATMGEITYNDPEPTLNTFFGEPLAPDLNILPVLEFPACQACTVKTGYPGLLTGVFNVDSPSALQWYFQIERELPGRLKFTATYNGLRAYHIMRGIEGNHNLPCGSEGGQLLFPPACTGGGTAAPGITNMAFTLYAVTFDATSNYNAVTLGLGRRFFSGFTFNTSYTLAKGISESDTNNSGAILLGQATHSQYPPDRKNDRAESMMSVRHRFIINAIYELPFGRGKPFLNNAGGVVNALLGGWSINTLGEFRSGFPFSVIAGFGITGVGDALTIPDRTDILRYNAVLGRIDRWFDPKAYVLQEPGRLGNAPRNSVRGPNFQKLDFSLVKKFQVVEDVNVEFRAEFFNVLNHPNYDLPFNQLYVGFVPQFDHVPTQAELDALPCNLTAEQAQIHSCNPQAGVISRTASAPRQIQFGLKISF